MKRAAIAGFAAGAAMMIGGALGAVSGNDPRPAADSQSEMMNPMVGGQAMLPDRDIMENMAASPLHTALVAAMKDSGVAAALKTSGPFTLFAPTNDAMAQAGAAAKSARAMRYLIVPGQYDSMVLRRVISQGGGEARLKTAQGGMLLARMNGPAAIVIQDERGDTANITMHDVRDKNGIIHVVDRALQPGGASRRIAQN